MYNMQYIKANLYRVDSKEDLENCTTGIPRMDALLRCLEKEEMEVLVNEYF